ncbi:MAG: histidinol phosphate phosphatase [Rhodospirillaceae bacterium]|nr:histidinol phosphate phosphatase [Rhodospirillaceae bacterium]
MSGLDPRRLIAFADRLAEASGAVIRPYFRAGVGVDIKGDGSPVTRADREAEAVIRDLIAREFPDHGIWGEEHGRAGTGSSYEWVIDPIDGTKAFLCGAPLFGTLIALCRDGKPILGVLDQPIQRERWIGLDGHGTTLNGAPVRGKPAVPLGRAILSSTTPEMFLEWKAPMHERLAGACAFTRWGLDCYAIGLMASGYVDLMADALLKPWDYLALVPIVEGAGGVVTDWMGAPLTTASGETFLAGANPQIHADALARLKG